MNFKSKIFVFSITTIIIFIGSSFGNINYGKDHKNFLESEKNTIGIVKNNVRSVVFVSNIRMARNFWDMESYETTTGAGTGFVWDKFGHIVTNYHVVHQGDSFLISFHNDKKQYRARLVGAGPAKDIAILKLVEKPEKLFPIVPGKSNNLQVGQKTIAIGNPFGLDHTVTTGIVSALGRSIKGYTGIKISDMIQTDASINPGNSGGPLLDSSGKLIGMNSMIFSTSGASAGVGFAVPADTINRIVPQLIKHGKIIRPGVGINVTYSDQIKIRYNIKNGIIVVAVMRNGPANKAGLKGMTYDKRGRYYLGDILLAIDGKKLNTVDDIYYSLETYKPGDKVEITYLRDGKVRKTKLHLTEIN
ncbi:MAG: trypsin-like peptidase domain-containing protein [Bacteriovoracaceae bacterium]|nr:trypsin-like peptidase domain-containing protein [Bacteriovoracaceae bacterium]